EWGVESTGQSEVVLTRSAGGLSVRKSIAVFHGRMNGSLDLDIVVTADSAFRGPLELEWNLNLLGGGANPEAHYHWADQEIRHDAPGSVAAGVQLSFGNRYEGVAISVQLEPAAPQQWFPVETVSNSEAGFERVYQGSCLTQRWPLELAAGESKRFTVTMAFKQTRDRAGEEAG
ncbi:MAG TPA: alpha-amylase/4-alpha-glucanotransferase domain-containing protein, partial [Candidatus Limnocylindrales bacterium]